MKFPVFSLLAGNFRSRDGFARDYPSSEESAANPESLDQAVLISGGPQVKRRRVPAPGPDPASCPDPRARSWVFPAAQPSNRIPSQCVPQLAAGESVVGIRHGEPDSPAVA